MRSKNTYLGTVKPSTGSRVLPVPPPRLIQTTRNGLPKPTQSWSGKKLIY